jgi:hypothetical protein
MNMINKIKNIQTQTKHYLYEEPVTIEEDTESDQKPLFDNNQFQHVNVLGTGAFGHVLQSIHKTNTTETTYALKVLSKESIKKVEHLMEEVYILKLLKHPFIIKLEGTFQTAHHVCMVFELLLYGDLCTMIYDINDLPTLPFDLILFYLSSLVIVLDFIHDKGILYRDLKPENIMLDEKGYIKIIDMGLAKRIRYVNEYTSVNGEVIKQMVDQKTYTLCGTPEYLSPEILLNIGYDKSTDIWSLGVLLYELFMKKMPFTGEKNTTLENNITLLFTNIVNVYRKGFTITDDVKQVIQNDSMEKLIIELLNGNRDKRIGVKERTLSIFNHELFSNYKDMINDVANQKYIPSYIPNKLNDDMYESLTTLPKIKPFKGDNSLFADF